MNKHRNIFHLWIITLQTLAMMFFLATIFVLLSNWKTFSSSIIFITLLTLFITTVISIIIFSIINIIMIIKDYKKQYKKYKINFIMMNLKRERSALLISILFAFFVFPLFVMINSYLKSGLSKSQLKFAKRQSKIKNVDQFLKQPKVKKKLDKFPEIKQLIEDVIFIKLKKYDTSYNCNLFILKQLDKIKADYEFTYDTKDIYYIGMNF